MKQWQSLSFNIRSLSILRRQAINVTEKEPGFGAGYGQLIVTANQPVASFSNFFVMKIY